MEKKEEVQRSFNQKVLFNLRGRSGRTHQRPENKRQGRRDPETGEIRAGGRTYDPADVWSVQFVT